MFRFSVNCCCKFTHFTCGSYELRCPDTVVRFICACTYDDAYTQLQCLHVMQSKHQVNANNIPILLYLRLPSTIVACWSRRSNVASCYQINSNRTCWEPHFHCRPTYASVPYRFASSIRALKTLLTRYVTLRCDYSSEQYQCRVNQCGLIANIFCFL